MKKVIFLRIYLTLLIIPGISYSQLPANDPTWQIKFIDNFDSFDNSAWCWNQCASPCIFGEALEYNGNLLFNQPNGWLSIKCETVATNYTVCSHPIKYLSGAIQSKTGANIQKYGYFEISAKLPIGKGYWPAFWLNNNSTTGGAGSCNGLGWYHEIDIIERGGWESQHNDKFAGGYSWGAVPTCSSNTNGIGFGNVGNPSVPINGDMSNEHKYGLFWEPDRMTWYFDDKPVITYYDPINTPQHAMGIILNFQMDGGNNGPDGNTAFPAYFQINWVKIWQLTSNDGTSEPTCPLTITESICAWNTNTWATYVKRLKKSINIGGSSCTSNLNTSDNISLWATDFIVIDAGTTITANGTGVFNAYTTKCPH